MNKQKELWERLAKKNSKYYINSDYGKGITEKEFNESGFTDWMYYITTDTLIPKGSSITCLEIGCGSGRMTQYMANTFGKVIGTDISGEMIAQATKRLILENDDPVQVIELHETDGYTFPLEDNSVDFVFSYIVFQHFKTMEMVESNFKESFRVLKPGGMMKVRVRTDKSHLSRWWGGVACDEQVALKQGFKLIKKEPVEHYGLWIWLEKPLDNKE